MFGSTVSKEANLALVLALSGTVMALAAKGSGSFSLERVLADVLPDPLRRHRPAAVNRRVIRSPERLAA